MCCSYCEGTGQITINVKAVIALFVMGDIVRGNFGDIASNAKDCRCAVLV